VSDQSTASHVVARIHGMAVRWCSKCHARTQQKAVTEGMTETWIERQWYCEYCGHLENVKEAL